MQDALAILDVVGIRAVFVEGLGEEALFSPGAGVLVLDRGLSAEDVIDLADQAISLAAASLPVT